MNFEKTVDTFCLALILNYEAFSVDVNLSGFLSHRKQLFTFRSCERRESMCFKCLERHKWLRHHQNPKWTLVSLGRLCHVIKMKYEANFLSSETHWNSVERPKIPQRFRPNFKQTVLLEAFYCSEYENPRTGFILKLELFWGMVAADLMISGPGGGT